MRRLTKYQRMISSKKLAHGKKVPYGFVTCSDVIKIKIVCRRSGRPDGRHTRGRSVVGHQRGGPIWSAVVHGHRAAAEHGRPGSDHGVPATSTAVVVHQRRVAVHHRGRLGHRVGHVHAVRAQPARADTRTGRVATQVQERPAESARIRERLLRRHASAVLYTRARRLRRRQHIQSSREPRLQGRRVAGLRPVSSEWFMSERIDNVVHRGDQWRIQNLIFGVGHGQKCSDNFGE